MVPCLAGSVKIYFLFPLLHNPQCSYPGRPSKSGQIMKNAIIYFALTLLRKSIEMKINTVFISKSSFWIFSFDKQKILICEKICFNKSKPTKTNNSSPLKSSTSFDLFCCFEMKSFSNIMTATEAFALLKNKCSPLLLNL